MQSIKPHVLRSIIPSSVRLELQRTRRTIKDFFSGHLFRLAGPRDPQAIFPYRITITQPIRDYPARSCKVANLLRAASCVETIQLDPGNHLSFWAVVGPPTTARGFLPGRNLLDGQLVEQPGGGLCQLAGLIYHLGLVSGLGVLERHAHSRDIYREEERFTPLGADATVVFGYKDLRLVNPHRCPVRFRFDLAEDGIRGMLESQDPIRGKSVAFLREPLSAGLRVTTWVDGVLEPAGTSCYSS